MGNVKGEVKRAGQKAAFSPLMESLTRLGYGVRGFIYITMGMLALSVVLGKGGAPVDPQGAIAAIGRQPAGLYFLWVVLIGLVSYALWGIIRAVFDPLHKGNDMKGVLARVGFLLSAASYSYLALYTYGLISGAGNSGQSGPVPNNPWHRSCLPHGGGLLVGLVGFGHHHRWPVPDNPGTERQFR